MLALAALAAGVAGCGRPGAERDVSPRELALMPLPRRDLPEARSFTVSPDSSGAIDGARAAETTIDPYDTPAEVAKEGWRRGYTVSYVEPGLGSLGKGGVLEIDTSVTLFRSDVDVDRFNTRQTGDFDRFARREVDAGVVLLSSSTFRVRGIGDSPSGLRAEFRIGGRPAWSTFVDFRVGSLLCEAAITRADSHSADARVEAMARSLEQRVHDVEAGKVHGRPEAVPAPAPTPQPPAGLADLSARGLQVRDLPEGSRIRRESYVRSPGTQGSFRRDFHVGAGAIGGSRVLSLQSGVDVFRSEAQARQALSAVAGAYESGSGPQLLARLFSGESGGAELTQGRLVGSGRIDAGTLGFAVAASFEAPPTRVTGVLLVVQVGNKLGSLVATGETGRLRAGDLVPLARKLARRLGGGKLKI